LSRPWSLRAGAHVCTLGVRFRPGAAAGFLGIDMSAMADCEVLLASIAGRSRAAALADGVTNARTPSAALGTAALWLDEHRRRMPAPQHAVTRPAVQLILRARGETRIADVAARLNVHPRRLERAFARELGIRPKLFARIVRLNAALAMLGRGERNRAVEIALAAGYFDQSHMSRDFRVVAGRNACSPRQRDGEMSRHFTAPERLLALLAGE
jgi:AraC-like DNA-binding protein